MLTIHKFQKFSDGFKDFLDTVLLCFQMTEMQKICGKKSFTIRCKNECKKVQFHCSAEGHVLTTEDWKLALCVLDDKGQ